MKHIYSVDLCETLTKWCGAPRNGRAQCDNKKGGRWLKPTRLLTFAIAKSRDLVQFGMAGLSLTWICLGLRYVVMLSEFLAQNRCWSLIFFCSYVWDRERKSAHIQQSKSPIRMCVCAAESSPFAKQNIHIKKRERERERNSEHWAHSILHNWQLAIE